MKAKTYIAVILTFIFMAKFVAIDANGLNHLFGASDITFVNPHCKNENPPRLTNNIGSFSQADDSAPLVIVLNGFCTSQFKLELFSWEADYSEPITVFNEHFSSILRYLYLDNASPPPRLA
ncbi:MAG: hypothetical protein ACKVJF_04170 [Flavobacteriales bacterium]